MSTPAVWAVQSCGALPEQGYTWLPAGQGPGADPDLLLEGCAGRSVSDLVDDTKPSLLLYALRQRSDLRPRWILLLTGLRPPGAGTDHMRRAVRATVLGTADAAAPPPGMLALACLFLTGSLEDRLPLDHGLPAGTPGFALDPARWAALLTGAGDGMPGATALPDPREVRTDTDSPETRSRAAGMLAALAGHTAAQPTSDKQREHNGFGLDAHLVGPDARPLLVVTTLLGGESLQTVMPLYGLGRRITGETVVPRREARGSLLVGQLRAGWKSWTLGVLAALAAALAVLAAVLR
ncbi:hypothetical protein ACIBCM_31045 [Streptomyces sp. NPDC051018]|uniref:hypothetical protein n=1 Tax=Streptomyces sp. NPDC051018 TaxID=3365639 RepID=UPI00378FA49A